MSVNEAIISSIEKQRGAVLLEAAYILPLMLAMALFILDVVVYSADRLSANNVMADTYRLVMGQANSIVPGESGKNVNCVANLVQLNTSEVEKTIRGNMASLFKDLSSSDVTIKTTTQSGVTPQVYIVNASFPSQTIFLPDTLAQTFPVKSQLILSFDLGC